MGAFLFHLFLLSVVSLSPCAFADGIIPEKDAIQIATVEVEKLGYDVKNMKVLIERNEGPRNACLGDEAGEYIEYRKQRLVSKEYYTVSFSPKELQLGGNACVFVDQRSGQIIEIYRGR